MTLVFSDRGATAGSANRDQPDVLSSLSARRWSLVIADLPCGGEQKFNSYTPDVAALQRALCGAARTPMGTSGALLLPQRGARLSLPQTKV